MRHGFLSPQKTEGVSLKTSGASYVFVSAIPPIGWPTAHEEPEGLPRLNQIVPLRSSSCVDGKV